MVVATAGTVGVVVAQSRDNGNDRASSTTTTTRPPTTNPATTTTRAAPTTTVALVTATGTTGNEFTIAKPSYTLLVAATADCWVDARDPSGGSLFSGLLSAGQSQPIAAAAMNVNLGNPAAITMTVEGKPVPFTLANGSPVTVHLRGTGTTG